MSTGKDISDFKSREDDEARQHEQRKVLLPYLILILSQLPLTAVYLSGIWNERPHYLILPLAITAFAFFVFYRWPRNSEAVFFNSSKSNFFLVLGVVFAIAATLFLSPWLSYAALLLLLGSLLSRTNDRKVFGTALGTMAPLLILLQPPAAFDFDTVQGDISFLGWVKTCSTSLSSNMLDLQLYPHNFAGFRMEFPTQEFTSIHLGNGFFSIFGLLLLTCIYIAARRIPMFRGAMLLIAATFWFIAFEAIELTICVVSALSFEQDLYAPGTGNTLLQIAGLLSAIIMTLLSERLITFLFGPVDIQAVDENISLQNFLCRFWNAAISGVSSPTIDINIKKEVDWARKRNSFPEKSTLKLIWASAALLSVILIMQIIGLTAAAQNLTPSLLDTNFAEDTSSVESFLTIPDGFRVVDFTVGTPAPKTIFETDSFTWKVEDAAGQTYQIAISFPFTGWHNFDLEAESQDWKREPEIVTDELILEGKNVPYFIGSYQNSLALHRTLFNTQLDKFGDGFELPYLWANLPATMKRISNRLSNRTRPRLFSGRSIEIKVYLDTIGPNTPSEVETAATLFKDIVAQVESALGTGVNANSDEPSPTQ